MRARTRRGGDGLRDIGLEQFHLLLRGNKISDVALHRGLCARMARLRLLCVLHAAVAGGGKIGVALVLLLGEGLGGGIDVECRFGGVDHRLLHLELGALARDRGFGGGHVGLGLVKRHPEIAIIDFCQHLAGRDALVVADQHVTQVAGDFWRDGGVVGLHIGVVGRNQETADGPVIPAVPAGGNEDDGCSAREQDLA